MRTVLNFTVNQYFPFKYEVQRLGINPIILLTEAHAVTLMDYIELGRNVLRVLTNLYNTYLRFKPLVFIMHFYLALILK